MPGSRHSGGTGRKLGNRKMLRVTLAGQAPSAWRKGWDSNPRYSYLHSGFRDRRLRPLGHPSAFFDTASRRCLRPANPRQWHRLQPDAPPGEEDGSHCSARSRVMVPQPCGPVTAGRARAGRQVTAAHSSVSVSEVNRKRRAREVKPLKRRELDLFRQRVGRGMDNACPRKDFRNRRAELRAHLTRFLVALGSCTINL